LFTFASNHTCMVSLERKPIDTPTSQVSAQNSKGLGRSRPSKLLPLT
jgi:hypothetical protein